MHITALPVAVPLIAAALLVAIRRWTPRLVIDAIATGTGLAVVALCALLPARAAHAVPGADARVLRADGAAAYALTAYHNEEQGPIQGAINFAISNSVGAYAIFIGTALLYARTGALNMAQIGAALDAHHADPLVLVAMSLLFTGFRTKAAAVPVHFWLADAHAVAPPPVSVLFSGVMVELGIYAVARIYYTIFAAALVPHADELRVILICLGTVTALWGAIMCFAQRHIKRLPAFSTISHVGMFVCGIGLLSAQGIAGVAVYVIGHGPTKAALFMLTGVLLHRFASIDEFDLHGKGRATPLTGVMFTVGGSCCRRSRW